MMHRLLLAAFIPIAMPPLAFGFAPAASGPNARGVRADAGMTSYYSSAQRDALATAMPIICGRWELLENLADREYWGKKLAKENFLPFEKAKTVIVHEVFLSNNGKVEQPLNSALKGLDWKIKLGDLFGSHKMELKIVHPPQTAAAEWYTVNDQLPVIQFYSGSFVDGLGRCEGWIERYADVDDGRGYEIRRRVRVGRFRLQKLGVSRP